MLERDFDEIPDLYFNIELLISDPPYPVWPREASSGRVFLGG